MGTVINGEILDREIKAKFGGVSSFAQAAGVSRAYIYRIIAGELPAVERLVQFAELLDLTVDDLLVVESPKDPALAVA